MLCVLFAIMYLDRVNISAAAGSVKSHFRLNNTEMGLAFSAFSWAYLASVLFGGWGASKYGARVTLLVCVSSSESGRYSPDWSAGSAACSSRGSWSGWGGAGFPGGNPGDAQLVSAARFGYIQGITHSASRLGAAIAPPMVAWLIVLVRLADVLCHLRRCCDRLGRRLVALLQGRSARRIPTSISAPGRLERFASGSKGAAFRSGS